MRISFSTVILLLALIAGTAWAGWWSISSGENDTTIRIDNTEIRSDTAEIRSNLDNAVRNAKHAVDSIDRDSETPETSDPSDG